MKTNITPLLHLYVAWAHITVAVQGAFQMNFSASPGKYHAVFVKQAVMVQK